MAANQQQTVKIDARTERACAPQSAFVTDVQPPVPQTEGIWGDRDARNNRLVVAATAWLAVAVRR